MKIQGNRSKLAVLAAVAVAGLLLLLWLTTPESPPEPARGEPTPPRYLVGAHYRLTLPEEFQRGFLRGRLTPPQSPAPGLYQFGDASVMERHIDLAAEYGVDFFCLEYWPNRPVQDIRPQLFLQTRNLEDIRFCLSFQLKGLGYDESLQAIPIEEEQVERFVADLQAAEPYLRHPRYLKVQGRPVLFLQDAHLLRGEFAQLLERGRSALSQSGAEPFFLGDQMTWAEPREDRIRLFDAVTSSQPFDPQRREHSGYGAASNFLQDLATQTQATIDATAGQIPVLPPLLPGFNERGRTGSTDSAILPREWKQGEASTSHFAQMYRAYARPFEDERLPLLLVTSWNGWGEDTAIEPMRPAAPTREDESGSQSFSGGYLYQGFGSDFLETLQNETVAVSGIVENDQGHPVSGTLVAAWKDRKVIATDLSDSQGRFHLSRLTVGAGEVLVGTSPLAVQRVTVEPLGTTRGIRLLTSAPPQAASEESLAPVFPELAPSSGEFNLESYHLFADGPWRFYQSPSQPLSAAWPQDLLSRLKSLVEDGQTILEVQPRGGRHTAELARLVGSRGRILAVVSEPERYGQLQANLQLNELDRVETLHYALGAALGWQDGTEKRTLDSFHLKDLRLLVLPASSALEVLEGANETLESKRPYVLVDALSGPELGPLRSHLARFGYRVQTVGENQCLAAPVLGEPGCLNLQFGLSSTANNLVSGFSRNERQWPGTTFVWSDDVESQITFDVQRLGEGNSILGLCGSTLGPLSPLQVTVLLNGARLDTLTFSEKFEGHEMLVPAGLLQQGKNTLLLRYGQTGRPADLVPGESDNRALAFALAQLWLAPESQLE